MYLGPSYRGGVTVTRADGSPDVLWNERLGEEGLEAAVRFVRDFDGAHGGLDPRVTPAGADRNQHARRAPLHEGLQR